jgi:hypothetical protein
MTDGSVAIGATVRAGVSGLGAAVRACWGALLAAVLISALSQVLPPAMHGLGGPLALGASILAWGGLYRHAFGRAPGWAGLRWGLDEWHLLGAHALIAVIFLVVGAVLLTVVGAIALGVARANAPDFDATSAQAWRMALAPSGPGAIVAGTAPLLGLALLAWLAARLSLTAPATVDQGQIRVLSAFPLTRGLVLPILVAGLVLAVPMAGFAAVSSLIGRWAGPGLKLPLALLSAVFAYGYLAPVWTGALVHIYRRRATPAASLARDV